MKKLLFFLLCFLFKTAWVSGQVQYSFTRYTQQDGLASGFISGITEDKNGFIWIASEKGLTRFDGYTFRTYSHDPNDTNSLPDNSIRELTLDENGTLICRTEYALNKYDLTHDRFTNIINLGKNVHYRGSKAGLNHDMWILTEHELVLFETEHGTRSVFPFPAGYVTPDDNINIEITKDGKVWLLANSWILLFDTQSKKVYPVELKNLENSHVRFDGKNKTLISKANETWIYCQAGLFKFEERQPAFILVAENKHFLSGEGMTTKVFSCDSTIFITTSSGSILRVELSDGKENLLELHFPGKKENVKIKNVLSVTNDIKGVVWIGTEGEGLYRFDPLSNSVTQFRNELNNPNSLSSDYIQRVFIDRSGVIWLCCKGLGLVKMEAMDRSFITCIPVNAPNQVVSTLNENNVRAIVPLNDSTLLVGTLGGLASFNEKNRTFSKYVPWNSSEPLMENNPIGAILKDETGKLWIGGWGSGVINVCDVPGKKIVRLELPPSDAEGNPCKIVRAFCKDNTGNIWIATICGLFMLRPADVDLKHPGSTPMKSYFYSSSDQNSITDFRVFALLADRKNRIWIGTQNGLNMLEPSKGKIKRFFHEKNNPQSLSANNVRCLLTDSSGVLWIGTNEGGLNKFDEATQTFKAFTKRDGLPDNSIYSMQEDERGFLWLSSQTGICRFDPRTNASKNFTMKDGLQNLEFNTNASLKTPDGMMVFGGISGFNIFYPDFITENYQSLPVTITRIKVFDKDIPTNQEGIELKSWENYLSFEFASMSHYRNQEHQYEYKLEGFDQNWVFAGNRRYVTYTNLSPGKYIFYVKTTDTNSSTDNAASLNILIHLPWYRTPLALLLFAIGIISLGYIIYRSQVERLIRKERANTRVREAELKALALAEKNKRNEEALLNARELEKAYHELQLTQSQLLQKEKLASLGQLTAGVAHEINNPINFVYSSVPSLKRNFEDIKKLISEYEKLELSPELKQQIEKIKASLDIDFTITESDTLLRGISEGASRTAEIVRGLRNFSRTDEVEMRSADINEGILSTLLLLSKKIEDKSISIEKQLGLIPTLLCFPGQLNQLWMNLLANAIDAVSEYGKIQVTTSVSADKKELLVSIKDNGVGMTEEIKKKIFDPFFTTKETGKGTGLGLSISYGIIEKHKGKIEVKTEPGVGTEFIVKLPLE